MKFGLYLNTQAPPSGIDLPCVYDELLETAQVAEASGFDCCFLPEHHQQPDGYLPAPFVMAGAIAASTDHLGIATGVHILPIWHPFRVAEDVAVLDNLSRGRFVLGVGLGLVEEEFVEFDVDMSTAVSRFEEQVELLRRSWTDDPVWFAGQHFTVDGLHITPKPIKATVPVLIGGMSEKAVGRAGRIGDGWITDPLHSISALTDWASIYRAAARSAGQPSSIWVQRDCWVSDNADEIADVWAPHLVEDWRFYFQLGLFSSGRFNPNAEPWIRTVNHADEITFDRLRHDRVLVGDPDDVLEQIESVRERLDPTGIALRMRYPHGPAHEETLRAIRLFGENVIQRIRAR